MILKKENKRSVSCKTARPLFKSQKLEEKEDDIKSKNSKNEFKFFAKNVYESQ